MVILLLEIIADIFDLLFQHVLFSFKFIDLIIFLLHLVLMILILDVLIQHQDFIL